MDRAIADLVVEFIFCITNLHCKRHFSVHLLVSAFIYEYIYNRQFYKRLNRNIFLDSSDLKFVSCRPANHLLQNPSIQSLNSFTQEERYLLHFLTILYICILCNDSTVDRKCKKKTFSHRAWYAFVWLAPTISRRKILASAGASPTLTVSSNVSFDCGGAGVSVCQISSTCSVEAAWHFVRQLAWCRPLESKKMSRNVSMLLSLAVGAATFKTKTIKKTVDPEWNETFEVGVKRILSI